MITAGILVIPPTSITSEIFFKSISESLIACLHGPTVLSIKPEAISSNFALVMLDTRCLGPFASAVIKGKLISVWVTVDNSILALSTSTLSLCSAAGSFFKSIPSKSLNSLAT